MDGEQGAPAEEHAPRSIAELYDEVESVITQAFPKFRDLWVRGEVQKISESAGHAYIDIVDPETSGSRQAPTLKVKCWKSTWTGIKRSLASQGLYLEAGMTVVIRGSLDFYRPRAEVGFILAEVDVTALLGRLALERAALLEALEREGLIAAQQRIPVPAVPLRVGLVGSPGTEGFNDFLGQLERSGFSFSVVVARSAVQGQNAPSEVSKAIALLASSDVDLICVVRGGGSKGDLVAFDAEEVARSIALCQRPVWTGIGHTGDESVADLVANQRAITPTACGAAVVDRVASYWSGVAWAAGQVARDSVDLCRRYEQSYTTLSGQLVGAARGHLRSYTQTLRASRRRLVVAPARALRQAQEQIRPRASRLAPLAGAYVENQRAALSGKRRLLSAYDPVRTLERGWSLTLDDQGKTIRSVHDVGLGSSVTTKMADGSFTSTVEGVLVNEEEQ